MRISWCNFPCRFPIALAALLAAAPVYPDTATPLVAKAGYGVLNPLPVAPGQILTFFVAGIGDTITKPILAEGERLPTTLAGISVRLYQPQPVLFPILELRPMSTCPVYPFLQRPCGKMLAVTVQVPFEIVENLPFSARPDFPAQLTVLEGSTQSGAVDLLPMENQIHLLRACDLERTAQINRVCGTPIVSHADGKLLSETNPAQPGETLVMYALGLGRTDPPVPTGVRSPSTLSRVADISVDYIFGLNLTPSSNPEERLPVHVDFVGLVPGSVGLYQVNFTVPPASQNVRACSLLGSVGSGGYFISSNLTITVEGSSSSDSIGICVDVNVE